MAIDRYRALEHLSFNPGPCTVILGPNNAGKSTVLEALDLLLHPGLGRPRPAPSEVDFFRRDPDAGFQIEAVIGDLHGDFLAEVRNHLEGWREADAMVVPEPDGEGIEPIVRVRARAGSDLDLLHDFSKPESEGARFHPGLRVQVGWVFDGRTRDPARQLAFYQGGLLDRLFGEVNLDPAVEQLRGSLTQGAGSVNDDAAVAGVLGDLAGDLRRLALLHEGERPLFEVGGVSRRELLQALRLALPGGDVNLPLERQGRGAQRLLLVSVLLRLAAVAGQVPIAGVEEPEEALEPIRQAQLARMLRAIADGGGQIFVVTHSAEVARAFEIDDFLLLKERTAGADARFLRGALSAPIRQAYERRLDGSVVRGLFARIPALVEGPSDRAVFETFWTALAEEGVVPPTYEIGLDVVITEGAPNLPMLAAVLDEAGKAVAVWAEQDTQEVRDVLAKLRDQGHCSGIVLHDDNAERSNLEGALAFGCRIDSLAHAMRALAEDRGYTWDQQRNDLLSRCEGVEEEKRKAAKTAGSLEELFAVITEEQARHLIASALSAKGVTPFEMKGARQARVIATGIVAAEGVPPLFRLAFRGLAEWVAAGCIRGTDIPMTDA